MIAILFPNLDPVYWLILGVSLVLSLVASARVKAAFARWSEVPSRSGFTGAQVARAILQAHGIRDVQVEPVAGNLTDHYDPTTKTLRLSEPVFHSHSVAALGVAAHEVGHAIQHATKYAALQFRSAWVPVASIGSSLGLWVTVIGLVLGTTGGSLWVAWAGIALFAATTVFTLVTLPVEFDASRRALATLQQSRVLAADEVDGARAVLNAAALTYVAAAAASVMTLLYYLFQVLAVQGRREE